MCVDLSHLNRFVIREKHQFLTPAQAITDIAASDAKYFTVIDAPIMSTRSAKSVPDNVYYTLCDLNIFVLLIASAQYQSITTDRQMTKAFNGLSGFRHAVDDFFIYDSNLSDHIVHVKEFLKHCANQHIALNAEKCRFFQIKTTFVSFLLSDQCYQVDPAITDAIARYPVLTNRTELRSFVGLVNQLSSRTNAVAFLLTPFRALLSTKNEFTWSPYHDTAFTAAKASLTTQANHTQYQCQSPRTGVRTSTASWGHLVLGPGRIPIPFRC